MAAPTEEERAQLEDLVKTAIGFDAARGDQPVASLGIVGPTHMDYPGTMAAVHAVARYVSHILDEQ